MHRPGGRRAVIAVRHPRGHAAVPTVSARLPERFQGDGGAPGQRFQTIALRGVQQGADRGRFMRPQRHQYLHLLKLRFVLASVTRVVVQ
jgi:hypothetical protein